MLSSSPPKPPPVQYQAPHGTRWDKEKTAAGGAAAFDLPSDPKNIGPWILGECVGKGASGRVKIAKHCFTGELAAVKILPVTRPSSKARSAQSANPDLVARENLRLGIMREIMTMKLMNHPNILRLYDAYETDQHLFLVIEYVGGGELFDFLVNRGRLPASEALVYFKQIIYGLNYAHTFSIIHRDLKPENILIASFNPPLIKIADWGMATYAPADLQLETSCGSPHYASPEIVNGEKYSGNATDIWSCGVILFALLTGHLPFDDKNVRTLLGKVKHGKYEIPAGVNPLAKDLIQRMLVVDVSERITIPEILAHPWLRSAELAETLSMSTPTVLQNLALPPSPSRLAQPVSPEAIDPEILDSLCIIWSRNPKVSPDTIRRELSSPPGRGVHAKAFYFLLSHHRDESRRTRSTIFPATWWTGYSASANPPRLDSLLCDKDGKLMEFPLLEPRTIAVDSPTQYHEVHHTPTLVPQASLSPQLVSTSQSPELSFPTFGFRLRTSSFNGRFPPSPTLDDMGPSSPSDVPSSHTGYPGSIVRRKTSPSSSPDRVSLYSSELGNQVQTPRRDLGPHRIDAYRHSSGDNISDFRGSPGRIHPINFPPQNFLDTENPPGVASQVILPTTPPRNPGANSRSEHPMYTLTDDIRYSPRPKSKELLGFSDGTPISKVPRPSVESPSRLPGRRMALDAESPEKENQERFSQDKRPVGLGIKRGIVGREIDNIIRLGDPPQSRKNDSPKERRIRLDPQQSKPKCSAVRSPPISSPPPQASKSSAAIVGWFSNLFSRVTLHGSLCTQLDLTGCQSIVETSLREKGLTVAVSRFEDEILVKGVLDQNSTDRHSLLSLKSVRVRVEIVPATLGHNKTRIFDEPGPHRLLASPIQSPHSNESPIYGAGDSLARKGFDPTSAIPKGSKCLDHPASAIIMSKDKGSSTTFHILWQHLEDKVMVHDPDCKSPLATTTPPRDRPAFR